MNIEKIERMLQDEEERLLSLQDVASEDEYLELIHMEDINLCKRNISNLKVQLEIYESNEDVVLDE